MPHTTHTLAHITDGTTERMERSARVLGLWRSCYISSRPPPSDAYVHTSTCQSTHRHPSSDTTHVLVRGWFPDVRLRSSELQDADSEDPPHSPFGLSLCPCTPPRMYATQMSKWTQTPRAGGSTSLSGPSVDCLHRVLMLVKRHTRTRGVMATCAACSCQTEIAAPVHARLLTVTRYGHTPRVIVAEIAFMMS